MKRKFIPLVIPGPAEYSNSNSNSNSNSHSIIHNQYNKQRQEQQHEQQNQSQSQSQSRSKSKSKSRRYQIISYFFSDTWKRMCFELNFDNHVIDIVLPVFNNNNNNNNNNNDSLKTDTSHTDHELILLLSESDDLFQYFLYTIQLNCYSSSNSSGNSGSGSSNGNSGNTGSGSSNNNSNSSGSNGRGSSNNHSSISQSTSASIHSLSLSKSNYMCMRDIKSDSNVTCIPKCISIVDQISYTSNNASMLLKLLVSVNVVN